MVVIPTYKVRIKFLFNSYADKNQRNFFLMGIKLNVTAEFFVKSINGSDLKLLTFVILTIKLLS